MRRTLVSALLLFLAIGALVATFRFHVGMLKVLGACALGGIVLRMVWGN